MVMPEGYNELVKARKYTRAKISRLRAKISTSDARNDDSIRATFLEKVREYKVEIDEINNGIHKIADDNMGDEVEAALLADEERYDDCIMQMIIELREPAQPANDQPLIPEPQAHAINKVKLPTISLPVFSNAKSESLDKFFHGFEAIMDKQTISPYEKFMYLRGQLSKAPLSLISSLDTHAQTYEAAKKLLSDAFSSTLSQQYDAIKQLSELKLSFSDDVYEYISEMRNLMSSFKILKIDVELVLQYFIWNSMNDQFQTQLVNITNEDKPSLDRINECIFQATNRYLKVREQSNQRRYRGEGNNGSNGSNRASPMEVQNMAVNVKNKPTILCNLCTADGKRGVSHTLRECDVYKEPRDKVKKLDALGFCTRCSFRNHKKTECRFKFSSRCRNCNGEHFTYLCTNRRDSREATYNNTSCVHFNSVVKHDKILLPTFTGEIQGRDRSMECRTLYDTGSQRNFITEYASDKLKLEVVRDDVEVIIHGLGADKNVITNVVKVPLLIEGAEVPIEAIVVPTIDITIAVENLEVVAVSFREKGYILADRYLFATNSMLSGFDLVMGPDATTLFMPNTKSFGRIPDHSVYLETKLGVMLLGDLEDIVGNLKSLPNLFVTTRTNVLFTRSTTLEDNKYTKLTADMSNCSIEDVVGRNGELNHFKLEEATNDILESCSNNLLNYDLSSSVEEGELDGDVVNYILTNTERSIEGRLIMPLPWNSNCKHLLSKNYNLSKKILKSNFNKLKKDNKLTLYDDVFQEQESLGIIEKIEDVDGFLRDNPDYSFLAHTAIFKPDKQTTKVRVVLLSNLCERRGQENAVSHNNALLPGPCLNNKLITALMFSRFDKYILIFDLCKAFLSIQLKDEDQLKLLTLWYRCVREGDYRLVAYRNLRLSFGLRPSPTILMLGLYKILIMDTEDQEEDMIRFKQMIYNNIYMDNGLISADNEEQLATYYEMLPEVFSNYQFTLQQFVSSSDSLQKKIDGDLDLVTDDTTKFFGMVWDRKEDTLGPTPINLDCSAKTKRKILSSLNGVYDPFNLYGPIMNRAKLFFQRLQCDSSLKWDTVLSEETLAEWKLISKQANATPAVTVDRCVGGRRDEYMIVAFSDASSAIFGVVVYLVNTKTKKVSFLLAKSKVVSSKLSKKSIPTLECQGVAYAVEIVVDIYRELTGTQNILPVSVTSLYVYTDSMVTISWIKGYFVNYDKMQKRSTLVMNKLKQIEDLCNTTPVTFRFIEGRENPADCISRPVSYNRLINTCYYKGPEFLRAIPRQPDIEVTVPCASSDVKGVESSGCFTTVAAATTDCANTVSAPVRSDAVGRPFIEHLVTIEQYSSFSKLVNVHSYVIRFINNLKRKIGIGTDITSVSQLSHYVATTFLIKADQILYFADTINFFEGRNKTIGNAPNIVFQLNLYLDDCGIIRVKGKFSDNHPVLIHHDSHLTELIISDIHTRMSHTGKFGVLRELRKKFWILRGFATVKKLLGRCITCRKLNGRPIKLNQNDYRNFRSDPPKIPFAFIFADYIGPMNVRFDGTVRKVWLLIVTCLWSRAISLCICFSANTAEFLRALQSHIYQYGLFQKLYSDLGSQIVKGGKIISDVLNSVECCEFFSKHGITKSSFEHYPKGNSSLGSLVEICVKQVKSLIVKSVGKNILNYPEFQLLIDKTAHIVNRRPVAFKEYLCDFATQDQVPECITPEMLVYGRELLSLDLLLNVERDLKDPDYDPAGGDIPLNFKKMQACNQKLIDTYHEEFLVKLMAQAVSERDRFKPVPHRKLTVGDIVLLVEPHMKQYNYPMGLVKKINTNSLGEVTSAVIFKGSTRERVFRHATSLIPLLSPDYTEGSGVAEEATSSCEGQSLPRRTNRACAVAAKRKIREVFMEE